MKPVRQLVLVAMAAGLFMTCQAAHAGDKKLLIESTPTGAQVDVNGSITCTTPCTLNVSGAYFGAKHTVFSSRVDQPLSIRLLKDGYLPKSILLTSGPHVWKSFNGQNSFEYYLIDSDHFNFRLDPIQAFLGPSNSSLEEADSPTNDTPDSIQPEQIVRNSLPAIVQVQTADGSGSGFFITADGLVVTNAHVIGSQESALIITSNGATLHSNQIYVDQDRDLALVKVDAHGVRFLDVSPKLPMQGSDVIAIGTPGAQDVTGTVLLPNTVTKGVVSGVREFSDTTVANVPGRAGSWIQTDAAINHGNSGGPLLNRSGVVIGVNTLTFSATGTPGINFALASTELIQVVRSRLGISLVPQAKSKPETIAPTTAKLSISSTPPGADIEIDGVFLGSTPSDVTVMDGPRVVRVTKKGFKPYERTIQAQPNGAQRIAVELDPDD
jgi:serine protease Do